MNTQVARRNNNRSNRREDNRRFQQESLDLLRKLVSLGKQEVRFGVPAVRDVEPIRLTPEKVHTFQVCQYVEPIVSTVGSDTTQAFSFTLGGLNNATEFTSLFDQYRLVQVQAQFYPDDAPESNLIYTVIDYDDASALTGPGQPLEYGTLQVNRFDEYFERTLNPRASLAAYSGTFTSYAMAPQKMWLDCNSPDIQYYGLKVYIPATTAALDLNISFRMIWQFKNNR